MIETISATAPNTAKILERTDIQIRNRYDLEQYLEALISEHFPRASQDHAIDLSEQIVELLKIHSIVKTKFLK